MVVVLQLLIFASLFSFLLLVVVVTMVAVVRPVMIQSLDWTGTGLSEVFCVAMVEKTAPIEKKPVGSWKVVSQFTNILHTIDLIIACALFAAHMCPHLLMVRRQLCKRDIQIRQFLRPFKLLLHHHFIIISFGWLLSKQLHS